MKEEEVLAALSPLAILIAEQGSRIEALEAAQGGTEPAPTPTPTPNPNPTPTPTPGALLNVPAVGINLAAHANANQVLPGEAGTHFHWPSRADVNNWVKVLGCRLIRFPFALQRAILLTSSGLPGQGADLDPTFVAKFKQMLDWIREDSNGEAVIITDPHHYWRMYRNQTSGGKQTGALYAANQAGNQGGRWKVQEQVLISDANGWGPVHLANFLQKLVTAVDDPMILGWGLGNEPYPQYAAGALDYITVQDMEKKVVADLNIVLPLLRNSTKKPVFICGNHWASARNWEQHSASFVSQIKDPANNIVWEFHGYGDISGDSSGKYNSGDLNAFPVEQLTNVFKPAYAYFAKNGMRGFAGETGIPPTDSARAMLVRALDDAEKAGVPTTLWIAGPGMGGEKMNLEDAGHAKTRELLKSRFGRRLPEWKPATAL